MVRNSDSHESETARILKANYEDIRMSDQYRLGIQNRTRRAFARRSRLRVLKWVLGAVGSAALAALLILNHPAPPPAGVYSTTAYAPGSMAVVTSVAGRVSDATGRALQPGDRLSAGDTVTTSKRGRAVLVMRRGSELGLNGGSRVALAAGGVLSLMSGELFCANRSKEIARVDTDAGRVHLLGTVIDAVVRDEDSVAVTVAEGKVRLTNSHGESVVGAGKQAVFTSSRAPGDGVAVNVASTTAWYEGRNAVASDFGEIVYSVERHKYLAGEVWVMNDDGSGKRLLKTYTGSQVSASLWFPGAHRLFVTSYPIVYATEPDHKNRRAEANCGETVISDRSWIFDASTGQDMPFVLPAGYSRIYIAMSPDCTRLAFCGYLVHRLGNGEGGVWTYELRTGEVRKMADGYIKNPVVWSPDGRYLAFSEGENYVTHHPLVIADTKTGQIRRLNVQGAGPSFSPDGTKLAYCGGFKKGGRWAKGGHWFMGVPVSGSVFVADIASGRTRRLTAEGEGSLEPCWSPDGSRIAYMVMRDERESAAKQRSTSTLYVMNADGSDRREIVRVNGFPRVWSWTPSGKALYVGTQAYYDTGETMVMSADGSGVLANLGGTATDSILTPQQKEQMDGAIAMLREAMFRYAVGETLAEEHKKSEAAAVEFRAAAELFGGIVWRYPLARFSNADLQAYVDKAMERAEDCRCGDTRHRKMFYGGNQ